MCQGVEGGVEGDKYADLNSAISTSDALGCPDCRSWSSRAAVHPLQSMAMCALP